VSRLYIVSNGATEQSLLTSIGRTLEKALGLPTAQLHIGLGMNGFFDRHRRQYSSVLIMQNLLRILPRDSIRLLGIVEEDLFIPMLTFIYGQAQVNGPVALMSLARLRQEFYGLDSDALLLERRAAKEALHEVGHTFGLFHCLDQSCPMALSPSIERLDAKGTVFCPGCSGSIRENIDIITGRSAKAEGL
jgi:archaemetzincin